MPDSPINYPAPGTPYEIPEEGSLGLLALGYRGLVAWRAVRGTDWIEQRRIEYDTLNAAQEAHGAKETASPAPALGETLDSTPEPLPPDLLEGLSVTVVSGLPRSGTSMLMQMLTAGGLSAYTDGAREADTSNPRGYFEHERVKALARDHMWLPDADGLVVKVVAPLLRHLPIGPTYRIVFMERDLEEILRSQTAMLDRDGRASGHTETLRAVYIRQLAEAKAWIDQQSKASALLIQHREALADPITTAARINAFFEGVLNETAMSGVVDPSLHRQHTA